MAGEIEYLRETIARRDEEIRRRDHLLAAALERIPALEEPSSEPRETPQTVAEELDRGTPPPEGQGQQRRSWWRAFFGLE